MRVLFTGVCGFVGSSLARRLLEANPGVSIVGVDNLSRRGSERNIAPLRALGVDVVHGDVRVDADVRELPRVDWVVDCAALPSVLAGLNGGTEQLVGHNLVGTLNLLEKCRRDGAGFLLLSTSRVYSIDALNALPLVVGASRLDLAAGARHPVGFSREGIAESFSTAAPISLYGATKLASEVLALEYGSAFGFPVRVNRCGVIAGAGQFGRIDQGIFSYWMYQWLQQKPLGYIGFGGEGKQVRDFLSPGDLASLVDAQLRDPGRVCERVLNIGGGPDRALSLRELSEFCRTAFGAGPAIGSTPETRPFDIPYYVTDSARAKHAWGWEAREPASATLESIARWAVDHRAELASFV